jgi:hypothetical protein
MSISSGDTHDGTGADPQPTTRLSLLIQQLNACLTDPAGQTVGAYAETLQALHAELALAAGLPDESSSVDWDEILTAALPHADDLGDGLSAEQLARLF